MKHLNDYTGEAITQLLNSTGSFFAFSGLQLEEKKKEGVDYCSLGGGLVVPVANAQLVVDGLEEATKKGIQDDIAENGIEAIIRREIFNHECFFTGDIAECCDALKVYGVSRQDIRDQYDRIRSTEDVY